MLHVLQKSQLLRSELATVWSFMSDPGNLAKITPPSLGFRILGTDEPKEMYAGQIMEYTITPVLGIKLHWVTEITHVQDKQFFVDEQRFGPYAFWHHKHFMEETAEGVMMTDIVHYKLSLGPLGKLANVLFVKRQLEEIFQYRYRELDKLFNKGKA